MLFVLFPGGETEPVVVELIVVATTNAGAEVTVMTLVMTLGTQVEMVKVERSGADETAAAVETAAGREVAAPPGSETAAALLTGQLVVIV